MASGYTVLSNLNSKSLKKPKTAVGRFQTTDISIRHIYENEKNFYPQEEIEQKAAEIMAVGLLSNLTVKYCPCERGEYKLIDGERRFHALNYLLEKGHKEFEKVTCQIRDPENEHEEMIELILANSSRQKDIGTLIKEEQTLKREIEYLRKNGLTLNGYDLQKGRTRDIIASLMNISGTKVAEIEAVANRLIPSFLEALDGNRITMSVAYKISRADKQEQEELFRIFADKDELTGKEVEAFLLKEQEKKPIPGQITIMDVPMEMPEQKENAEMKIRSPNKEENTEDVMNFADKDVSDDGRSDTLSVISSASGDSSKFKSPESQIVKEVQKVNEAKEKEILEKYITREEKLVRMAIEGGIEDLIAEHKTLLRVLLFYRDRFYNNNN